MNLLLLTTFGEVVSYIGYILLAVLVLLVMITIHELGHYIAGKIFKFKIDEFAIGFGPKIFKKVKPDGEVFSLRLFPVGGFCAFHGEDGEETDKDSFNSKPPWQRIIVLVAGALMNYLLAIVIIATAFGIYGRTALITYYVDDPTPTYTQERSFMDKDVLLKADGKNIYLTTDLMSAITNKKQGDTVNFTVLRGGKIQNINVTLRGDTTFKNVEDMQTLYTALGISFEKGSDGQLTNTGLYATSVKLGFFQTIGASFEYSFKLAVSIFEILGQLITGSLGIGSMGGTITTVSVTANAIKTGGVRNLLSISAFIGVNLAVFNLLPFPALDGSRVVFTAIEWIFKKPVNRKVESIIHTVGLVLLLVFAIFVDLQRCF